MSGTQKSFSSVKSDYNERINWKDASSTCIVDEERIFLKQV